MKYVLTAVLGTTLLSACVTQQGPRRPPPQSQSPVEEGRELNAFLMNNAKHRGQKVRQVQFRVDGGKTLLFSMLYDHEGSLPFPAENKDYIIPIEAYSADTGQVAQSRLFPKFVVHVKKYPAVELEYVRIEQVDTADGSLQLLFEDEVPILTNQGIWRALPIPLVVTEDASPWLYSSGDSILLFKFTIKAQGSPAVVMYQPSFFSQETKKRYLR